MKRRPIPKDVHRKRLARREAVEARRKTCVCRVPLHCPQRYSRRADCRSKIERPAYLKPGVSTDPMVRSRAGY